MALITWEPSEGLATLRREVDRLFEDFFDGGPRGVDLVAFPGAWLMVLAYDVGLRHKADGPALLVDHGRRADPFVHKEREEFSDRLLRCDPVRVGVHHGGNGCLCCLLLPHRWCSSLRRSLPPCAKQVSSPMVRPSPRRARHGRRPGVLRMHGVPEE